MLKSSILENPSHVRFLLNNKVKTISKPVTGAALHAIAGNPTALTSGGKDVPNNDMPFDLKHDAKVEAKHEVGKDPVPFTPSQTVTYPCGCTNQDVSPLPAKCPKHPDAKTPAEAHAADAQASAQPSAANPPKES